MKHKINSTKSNGLVPYFKKTRSPTTHLWRRKGERRYSSYSFMTSVLDGVSGQRHAPEGNKVLRKYLECQKKLPILYYKKLHVTYYW
jgi:hypothetical protein